MRAQKTRAGFTLIELMIVVVIIGILAAIGIPAFVKYTKRSRTTEATMNLRRLFDSSVSYYDGGHTNIAGDPLAPQFPDSHAPTPLLVQIGSVKHDPAPGEWQSPTWTALNFAIGDPHFYAYQYDSFPDSSSPPQIRSFLASAFGNLDDDAIYSTFARFGTVDAGGEVRGGGAVYQNNELE